jgi:hypothetical protein
LVNRTFQRFAQESLFTNVALLDEFQVYSFHRAITSSSQHDNSGLRRPPIGTKSSKDCPGEADPEIAGSSAIDCCRPSSLAQLVRSIQFKWLGSGAMSKNAVNSICDIFQSCSSLQNIAMNNRLYIHFEEPILKALENKRLTKEFVLMDNPRERKNNTSSSMQYWHVEGVVGHLLSNWDSLETVELIDLSMAEVTKFGRLQQPIPSPICALKTIILSWFDIDGSSLSLLLKSSRESMRTLRIIGPSSKLDRPSLCQVLRESTGPDLESLTVIVPKTWYPIHPSKNVKSSDDPAKNYSLLDIVFKKSSALRKLKTLHVGGQLAGPEFFNFLPQSIFKLAWEICPLTASAFAKSLSSWRKDEMPQLPSQPGTLRSSDHLVRWLPNLKCCSVFDDGQNCRSLYSFPNLGQRRTEGCIDH